jgi:hypothetical protein
MEIYTKGFMKTISQEVLESITGRTKVTLKATLKMV